MNSTKTPKNKTGRIYANAQAIGLNPYQAQMLQKVYSAAELRKLWDYRALGFTIEDARKALESACTQKSQHRKIKTCFCPYHFCPRVSEYLRKQSIRNAERAKNQHQLARANEASSIAEITELTAGYGHGYDCRIALENGQLLIERIEDVTWSKNKSRHWPLKRQTSYQTTLINADGDTLASSSFTARRGDWLADVGKALGLSIGQRNSVSQTASMIPVSSEIYRGIKITRLRLFGEGFDMYCAEFVGTNFHAETRLESIRGLFRKVRVDRQTLLHDDEEITMTRAKKFGFCDTGIAAFLNEIDLDGRKSAKAGEIRSAMEEIDISPWVSELRMIGLIE